MFPSLQRSSSSKRRAPRRPKSPLEELIKCFCGVCESVFKKKNVEKAVVANEYETLQDPDIRDILKKFIIFRQAGSHIKPPIQDLIDCFELCEAVKSGMEDIEERRYDLEDFCFTELWEERLSSAIDAGTIDEFLIELMIECSRRLGEEPEYQMFKEELVRKLKK